MRDYLLDVLTCPVCHGDLAWTIAQRRGDRIEMAEARCSICDAAYLGLANIKGPDDLMQEMRRIVSGTLLAITHFYPEDDTTNESAINGAGLAPLLSRESALNHFLAAGWQMEFANLCSGKALPTPTGVVLEGAGIDTLPVADTVLTWCVLVGH